MVTAKKLTPWLLPYLPYYGFSHLTAVDKLRSSTRVQMSSAYPLPNTYPDYGFQEDPPLAHWFPHLHALLLCPIRSLFRIVGSSSRMDGGIISLLSTTALLTTSCRTRFLSGRNFYLIKREGLGVLLLLVYTYLTIKFEWRVA